MNGSIQKRDDRAKPWRARYRSPEGKEVSKSFTRRTKAEQWLRTELGKWDRGEWVDPQAGKATFDRQILTFMAARQGLRASTIARDQSIIDSLILPRFGQMPISSITTEIIEAWIGEMVKAGKSPATVRKAFEITSGALRSAVRARRISSNPAIGTPLPKLDRTERRFLSVPEIFSIAEAIDPRYRALVLIGGFGGLRLGELAALRIRSFGVGARTVTITETVSEVRGKILLGPPKTPSSLRTVALPGFVADEVAPLLRGDRDTLLFPLRPTNFRRREWARAVASAGLSGVTPHALRHSQAALLIAQGEHPLVVSKRLGHSSVRVVLDTYGHLFEGIDREAADRLSDSVVAQMRPKRGPETVPLPTGTSPDRDF